MWGLSVRASCSISRGATPTPTMRGRRASPPGSGVLASLATAMDAPRRRWWALVGLALGSLALTRENTLAFIPLFLIGFLVPVGQTRCLPGGGRAAVAFALGMTLVLLPVALRN